MVILAKGIGFLIGIAGLAIFFFPPLTQKLFHFFRKDKNIYWAGFIRLAAGLVLLFAASQSLVPVAAVALGILFLVSGIIIFVADAEKMKSFIAAYSAMPELVIRLFGLIAASFGILTYSIF